MKLITCPHPDRVKHGDKMKISYCKNKCVHRKTCEAMKGKEK